MNLVSDLDLPAFDYAVPDFSADRFHAQLAGIRQHGWLATSPLAYIVLDHDAGEFFLRSRKTAFPGRQIAGFFGVTGGPLAEHIDANILNLGGDQHRRLRALVGPALTPRPAEPVSDDRHRAGRAAPGRGAAARLVQLGAEAVRHPGAPDQPGGHRAGR